MNNISDLKIKGLDPNRMPSLKNSKYVDVIFELNEVAPKDWCADLNLKFSKNKDNAKINADERKYVETWVRNINDIPKILEVIKQQIVDCNNNYIEQKRQDELAWQKTERTKSDSRSDELDRILESLNFD